MDSGMGRKERHWNGNLKQGIYENWVFLDNNGGEDADGMEDFFYTPDNSRSGFRLFQTVVLQQSRIRHHLGMTQGP